MHSPSTTAPTAVQQVRLPSPPPRRASRQASKCAHTKDYKATQAARVYLQPLQQRRSHNRRQVGAQEEGGLVSDSSAPHRCVGVTRVRHCCITAAAQCGAFQRVCSQRLQPAIASDSTSQLATAASWPQQPASHATRQLASCSPSAQGVRIPDVHTHAHVPRQRARTRSQGAHTHTRTHT